MRSSALSSHPVAHRADCPDGFRPEVPQFEHEGRAMQGCRHVAGARGEELRGSGDDHVAFPHKGRDGRRARHVAGIVKRPLQKAFVGGHVGPDPNDANAVECLALRHLVPVAGEDFAFREIRCAGDHGDLMAGVHPFPAMLECPGRWSVDLRRKVVR